MNKDTIYREDAIAELWDMTTEDCPNPGFAVGKCMEAIKHLPSADGPQVKWIPSSEKLPKEKDGRVLITLEGKVTTATYSEFSNIWYIGDMCGVGDEVPTAWMPLPEPYIL